MLASSDYKLAWTWWPTRAGTLGNLLGVDANTAASSPDVQFESLTTTNSLPKDFLA
ncbi:MAG: hypothetical protein ACTJHY_15485 [Alcaligenes pakistanensis]